MSESISDTCNGQRKQGGSGDRDILKDEILRGIVQSGGILIPKVRMVKRNCQTGALGSGSERHCYSIHYLSI